jgi:hypothetical protein
MTIIPAYGRDYQSKAEISVAWNDDKDFIIQPSGQMINKQDAENNKIERLIVVYRHGILKATITRKGERWVVN